MASRDRRVTTAFLLEVKACVALFGILHKAALGSLQIWCSLKELITVACAWKWQVIILVWKKLLFSNKQLTKRQVVVRRSPIEIRKVIFAIWVLLFSKKRANKIIIKLFSNQRASQIMNNYDYHIHTNSKGSQGSKTSHWRSHLGHISGYDEFHSPSNGVKLVFHNVI